MTSVNVLKLEIFKIKKMLIKNIVFFKENILLLNEVKFYEKV